MSKNNQSPRRSRSEIARTAPLGPNRVHGEMPPTDIELRRDASSKAIKANGGAGTREHAATPTVDRQPNYMLRRIVVGSAALVGSIAGGNALFGGGDVRGQEIPTPTTIVKAEPGDTIWELQRAEATGSGVHPDVDIREQIDEAVELNGGTVIKPGKPVILVEMPNKPGSPQADVEMRQLMAEGAQVATNEQMINTQSRPNDIP